MPMLRCSVPADNLSYSGFDCVHQKGCSPGMPLQVSSPGWQSARVVYDDSETMRKITNCTQGLLSCGGRCRQCWRS